MQSWPGSGQQDGNGPDSWQQNFAYASQNPSFDAGQQWAQDMNNGQTRGYSQLVPQGGAGNNYFDATTQGSNSFGAGPLSGNQPQPGYHGNLQVNQGYSQNGQQILDPSTFGNVQPNLYAQQGSKTDAVEGLTHSQLHQSQPHVFNRQDASFVAQTPHGYQQPHHQYQHQMSRQPGQNPEQQYATLSQDPCASKQNQPTGGHTASYDPAHGVANALNGGNAHFQSGNSNFRHQQQQMYATPGQYSPQQQLQQAQQQQQQQQQPNPTLFQHHSQSHSPQPIAPAVQPPQSTPPVGYTQQLAPSNQSTPKRRKQGGDTETLAATEGTVIPTDSSSDMSTAKRGHDIPTFPVPRPSPEELQLLAQGNSVRVNGVPHLAFDGNVTIPAPKSYDKLAPMVAMPSQSGKSMIPELGYDLPCEIQGKFTSQYQPAAGKIGLEERKTEAKGLLDSYDTAMASLGKRRPKYTEYPHAFKEQLKSDEAFKNKKSKKESERDRNKPVRAAVRPNDPVSAAAWDAIGFVHIEDTSSRSTAAIAQRVQQAGDFFVKLRAEMNKSKNDLEQATKDGEPESVLVKKRDEAEGKKEALFQALDATLEHADDAVMDNLGGHHKLVLSLVNVLISCIKANDFSGKLPKIVLELFTHFRITKKIAETTNFDTVRKRFEDKGDDEAKELAREISAKVKKALKSSESETATGYTGTSAASRAKAAAKSDSSSTKRGRDDDADTRTVKKIAVEAGAGALSKKLAAPKAQAQPTKSISAPKTSMSSLLPGKARVTAKPVSKPEAVKVESPPVSSDDSSKKATTKADHTKIAAPSKAEKPPAPKMAAAPSSSALSGIASLLDSINAPKAELPAALPVKEGSESDAPETPAEAARRLRKEARRKLSVKWKPDEELVQVKIFHKDDNEDEGRASNMIRDAADDKSEGMVLKQRANIEDDEDDDDVPYQPWVEPMEIDFSVIPADARHKNYVTRGGEVTFSTDEQKSIAEREQKELMAIYTDPADIPPTPRSPLHDTAVLSMAQPTQLSTDNKFAEIHRRWADLQRMGPDGSLYAAMGRLDARQHASYPSSAGTQSANSSIPAAPSSNGATSITISATQSDVPLLAGAQAAEAILTWLRSEKVKQWQDPDPVRVDLSRPYQYSNPSAQAAGNLIEVLVRYLASKPYPATSPPDWLLQDEDKTKEWFFGYNKEMAAKQRKAEEDRLRATSAGLTAPGQGGAQEAASFYAQQQAYAPYMSILQQMAGGQQQTPQQSQLDDGQLQSILAAINQGPQQSSAAPPPPPLPLNPNDPSYQQLLMLSQMAQGQTGSASSAQSLHSERDRDREWDRNRDREWDRSRDRDRNEASSSRDDQYRDNRKKKPTLPPHKPINKALIGTKPCSFWQQGKCARGDQCTFRHD